MKRFERAPNFAAGKHPRWFKVGQAWTWGRSLFKVSAVVLAECKRTGKCCRLKFNGTVLVFTPKKSWHTVIWEFMKIRLHNDV